MSATSVDDVELHHVPPQETEGEDGRYSSHGVSLQLEAPTDSQQEEGEEEQR